MGIDEASQQLFMAAQMYPSAPGQAIEQLRPLADSGDSRAVGLLAYFTLQQGDIDTALPVAEKAARLGYGQVAQMVANDLVHRQRPDLRMRAPEFVEMALDSGWAVDVFSLVIASAQQGQPDLVSHLLNSAKQPRPVAERSHWDELVASVMADRDSISTAAAEVSGQREKAFQAIEVEENAVKERRADAEQQAEELGLVTSALASHNLANAYAEDARRTEKQSKRFTWASLLVGAVSVLVSAVGLLTVKEGSSFDTVIAHAAFGLPVALLAAYVNSLATTHRKEAWRLRHIELQIRTANPFLGLLDADRRKETLAALALRFFPGQEGMSPASKDGSEPPSDVIDALARLLHEQRLANPRAGTAPVAGPSAMPGVSGPVTMPGMSGPVTMPGMSGPVPMPGMPGAAPMPGP
jgi:hypothetical protein